MNNSKKVESNQSGIHKDLQKLVLRYLQSEFHRPIAEHTKAAFASADRFRSQFNAPVVLDSGCGTGLSTIALAKRFPQNPVIGIDKSEVRLSKADARIETFDELPKNLFYVRAELLDFWRLVFMSDWDILFHALFYPNPWPKQSELRYRFHAHPIFPVLTQLSPHLEMRTNWEIYADEFQSALEIVNKHLNLNARIQKEEFIPDSPISAFEKKFKDSGHTLWRIRFDRKASE